MVLESSISTDFSRCRRVLLSKGKNGEFIKVVSDFQLYEFVKYLKHSDILDVFLCHGVSQPEVLEDVVGLLCGTEVSGDGNDKFKARATPGSNINTEEPIEPPAEPTHNAAEPILNDVELTHNASEPTLNDAEPTHNASEPTLNDIEPTHNASEPTLNDVEPDHNNDENGVQSDVESSDSQVDVLHEEDGSEVDDDLRSLRAERRSKRQASTHKSIITILEEIRRKIMTRQVDMLKFLDTWISDIPPMARLLLEDSKELARKCTFLWNADVGFEIGEELHKHVVNLTDKAENWMPSQQGSQSSQGVSQPDAARSSSQPTNSMCDDTTRVRRVHEARSSSQPPPSSTDSCRPARRGLGNQLPPKGKATTGQKRGRGAGKEDVEKGAEKGPKMLDLASTRLQPGISSQRVIASGSTYKSAAPIGIDLCFKARGLRWKGQDAVTTSQLQHIKANFSKK
ncbi:hypothetical protein A4A49_17866 [Nicotiana attenuata]|uniref:Uncharacterized protein n=1 Tax=Nicotiana attenuata TaxID=49451 RepID=A0A314L050_NICAT|nr:hypothetical protein A4A49_17866 [Nicotiana attenuata]